MWTTFVQIGLNHRKFHYKSFTEKPERVDLRSLEMDLNILSCHMTARLTERQSLSLNVSVLYRVRSCRFSRNGDTSSTCFPRPETHIYTLNISERFLPRPSNRKSGGNNRRRILSQKRRDSFHQKKRRKSSAENTFSKASSCPQLGNRTLSVFFSKGPPPHTRTHTHTHTQ